MLLHVVPLHIHSAAQRRKLVLHLCFWALLICVITLYACRSLRRQSWPHCSHMTEMSKHASSEHLRERLADNRRTELTQLSVWLAGASAIRSGSHGMRKSKVQAAVGTRRRSASEDRKAVVSSHSGGSRHQHHVLPSAVNPCDSSSGPALSDTQRYLCVRFRTQAITCKDWISSWTMRLLMKRFPGSFSMSTAAWALLLVENTGKAEGMTLHAACHRVVQHIVAHRACKNGSRRLHEDVIIKAHG